MASAATDNLLAALEAMVFYEQRFAKPVAGTMKGSVPSSAVFVYLTRLTGRLPAEHADKAVTYAIQSMVAKYEHCPGPKDVRLLLAEGLLKALGLDFQSLYNKAAHFISLPPSTNTDAETWLNRLLYTLIRHITRERFMVIDPEEWKSVVVDVVFDQPLAEFSPPEPVLLERTPRNFSGLLKS